MKNEPKGFTFLELILVVATLGVLVFSLAPQDNLGSLNVETAAQRLEQDLRYARELALTKNTPCGIEVQANGDYLIYEGTTSSPALNPLTQESFSYNLGNDFSNVNILNVTTTLLIEFDSLGRPTQGGGSTIQVGDSLTTISLVVTPATGLVRRL